MNKERRDEDAARRAEGLPRRRLHPDIVRLGVVSFLTDVSSEMIFAVFSVFFTTVAGASSALLGLIEGLADLSASSLNYLAGWLSDRSGRRKWFAVAGYVFSTLAKSVLLAATSVAALAAFRIVERLGKGFRGPPRDAWLSSMAPEGSRGYAFGVHKALDKSGAVVGPLIAYALLSGLGESLATYALLFAVAFVPAVVSVILLATIPDRPGARHDAESARHGWLRLTPSFKRFLVPAGVFALAYFSLGFILLKAYTMGFSTAQVVLLYALFNATCVLVAPAIGRLGDRIGRSHVVLFGYALYACINLWLIAAGGRPEMVAIFALYGLFYAIEESQSKAFIADLEPERRATAIGAYNFVTGAAYLPASLIAGALWSIAPAWAFAAAAGLSVLAIAIFLALRPSDVLGQ